MTEQEFIEKAEEIYSLAFTEDCFDAAFREFSKLQPVVAAGVAIQIMNEYLVHKSERLVFQDKIRQYFITNREEHDES